MHTNVSPPRPPCWLSRHDAREQAIRIRLDQRSALLRPEKALLDHVVKNATEPLYPSMSSRAQGLSCSPSCDQNPNLEQLFERTDAPAERRTRRQQEYPRLPLVHR